MGTRPTLTARETPGDADGEPSLEPVLFLALDAEHPLASCGRFALGDVDEVVIGRDDERRVERTVERGKRVLSLRLDQSFMSSRHARLESILGRWQLEDGHSKNGSRVNGQPVQRQALVDGDVLELGRAFFVYRQAVARPPGERADVMVSPRAGAAAGVTTLVPSLAGSFEQLEEVARSPVSVVLRGEVGTGKEVIARAVHRMSGRPGPFISVNCGALPAALVESELFGSKKGAFSGAAEERPGLIRAADKGTLFLDEIGELPLSAQVAFLRVLQEREVVPVGGTRAVPVDLRLVAATHRDLDSMVAAGTFRADLLSRLWGFTLELPPLRDRREDLGLLVAALLPRLSPESAERIAFRPKAARCLFRHEWPGNVRELEKCLGAAVVLARGAEISIEHLPPPIQAALERPPEAADLREQLHALLGEHAGNVSAVARVMGKAPMQIRRWMKRYGMELDRFRK